jgi:hypothetical protein
MKVKKTQLYLVCGILSYLGAIMWVYKQELSPAFFYMGLRDKPLSLMFLFCVAILSILPIAWMPGAITRPSHLILWLLYLLVVIPSCVMPYFVVDIGTVRTLQWASVIIFTFWLIFWCSRLTTIKTPGIGLSNKAFWAVVFGFSFLSYYVVLSVFGLQLNVVSLAEVYSVREAYKEDLAEGGRWVSYMVLWQTNVVNPLFISQGLIRRVPLLLVLGVCGQIFLYSITGFKSILFSTPLLVIALVALQFYRRRAGSFFVWGAVFLIGICVFFDKISGSILFSSIFVRRLMIVPGQLSAYYYEFFSDNPFYMLQHSILRPFVDRSYDVAPAMLIGDAYFGNFEMSANANLWADAFANFGFAGMFAYAVIFGFVLQFLDKVAEGQDLRASCLLVTMPAISLCNTSLLTTLLTHGLGFAILMVYLMPVPQTNPVQEVSPSRKKHKFGFLKAKTFFASVTKD